MDGKERPHFETLEMIAEGEDFGLVLLCEWFGEAEAPPVGTLCTDAHDNTHTLSGVEAAGDGLYIVRLPRASCAPFGRAYRDVKALCGDCLFVKEPEKCP